MLGDQLDSPRLEFSAGDDFPCSTLQVVKVPHRLAGDVDASPETDEEVPDVTIDEAFTRAIPPNAAGEPQPRKPRT